MRDDEPFETDQSAELSDELNQLARQLRGFQPGPSGLDREQLMFQAGRVAAFAEINPADSRQSGMSTMRFASVRMLRLWQTAALLMTAVSLSLATSVVLRGNPEPKIVIVERNGPALVPTVVARDVTIRAQPIVAEKTTVEQTTAEKTGVNPTGTNLIIAKETSIDQWSSPIAQRSSSRAQNALEFALANTLSQRGNSGRVHLKSAEPNRNMAPIEPALSPLSLRGNSSGLLIHRLVEEHAL